MYNNNGFHYFTATLSYILMSTVWSLLWVTVPGLLVILGADDKYAIVVGVLTFPLLLCALYNLFTTVCGWCIDSHRKTRFIQFLVVRAIFYKISYTLLAKALVLLGLATGGYMVTAIVWCVIIEYFATRWAIIFVASLSDLAMNKSISEMTARERGR